MAQHLQDEFLWSQRYRPHKISETILPVTLKKTFQTFVDQKNVPNLLLNGPAGVGKTTIAMAMLDELGCDYMLLNGSLKGNIDTLRNEIHQFASSMSLTSAGRKYVILDEADYLNAQSTQPALRNFMEEFSRNCGFILTSNFRSKIIEPLQSRCSVVEFVIPAKERPQLAAQFFKRVCQILDNEQVDYEQKAVAAVIEKHFPDWRRCLNELQRYAATGKIDTGILIDLSEKSFKQLVGSMKEKNFTAVRKWVAENADIDSAVLYRKLYDTSVDNLQPSSIPQLVLIIANYSYKAAFVADQEINTVACLTEVMADCTFK